MSKTNIKKLTTKRSKLAIESAIEPFQPSASPVETFKSAVVRIRDILRTIAITNMDSMRHICLYLLSRYTTVEKAKTLGIDNGFGWEAIMENMRTKNGGLQLALDAFYHPSEPCLIREFDRLFGTEKFSFDLKNIQKHKEILEILDKVEIDAVESEIDLLGWVYEQHLKTGSAAARDLGQYFTDRSICAYMTKLCRPGFKVVGVPESVCDPSMGTAGFLTAFVKYYKEYHSTQPIDWNVQQKEIYGYDNDPRVAAVARLNLFMELHGTPTINLETRDSLHEGPTLSGYDVILANMPFGIKGLKHADCCERVKNLKIRGTKSEPLFLQLMMASLNAGGRCAVVVPDGVLVNGASLHTETRRYLLDHFDLKRVIKMKGQFFMNTGIQPSILFFERTGKKTEVVEFWEIEKGDNGEVIEKMIVQAERAKIGAGCSLDMRRYMNDEKNDATTIRGYPIVKLGDIVDYENGKTLSSEKKTEDGEYDVMGGGTTYIGKTTTYNREGETVSISKSGASAGFVAYHNKRYWAGDCLTIVPKDQRVNIRFLYYYLKLNPNLTMNHRTGTTIPHCKWDDIKDVCVPCPPLAIQQEIVATLDRFYSPGTMEIAETIKQTDHAIDQLIAAQNEGLSGQIAETQKLVKKSSGLVGNLHNKMIDDLKAQMNYIMSAVDRSGHKFHPLGDLCDLLSGKTNNDRGTGDIPFYDSNGQIGVVRDYLFDGDFVITARVLSIGSVNFVSGKYWAGDNTINIRTKDNGTTSIGYIYYWLKTHTDQLQNIKSGVIPKIRKSDVEKLMVSLPPLDLQENIVVRLNALQTQIDALEALQKSTEDNARFILESYLCSYSSITTEDTVTPTDSTQEDDQQTNDAETTE